MTSVRLLPVPHAVSLAVVSGAGLDAALADLRRAADWPHPDTADALRPWALHGGPGPADGAFLVLAGGQVVGECGWIGSPDPAGHVEIGYGLAASQRGRGIGTAAVRLLCTELAGRPGVRAAVADVLVGNAASRALLGRVGFVEVPGAPPPYLRFLLGLD